MEPEDKTFSDVTDEAGAAFGSALDRILAGAGAEKSTAKPDEPAAPVDTGGTTPSDESAKPEESDDPEGQDDDPETETVSGDEKTKFDPAKTLAKYKTPEDRDQALIESQRAIIEANAERRRLREELDAIKAGKPSTPASDDGEPKKPAEPAPAETPQSRGESYADWMGRISKAAEPASLSAEDRQVHERLSTLKTEKVQILGLEQKYNESLQKQAVLKQETSRLQTLIDDLQAALTEDPEDYGAKNRLEKHRATLDQKQRELQGLQYENTDLRVDIVAKKTEFDRKVVQFDADAQSFHSELSTVNARQSRAKDLNGLWKQGLADVFKTHEKHKFDDDERSNIINDLERTLNVYVTTNGGAPPDLRAWIAEQKAPVEKALRIRSKAGASVATRAASLEPGSPSETKIPSKKAGKSEKPRSWQDENEAAFANFDRFLKVG